MLKVSEKVKSIIEKLIVPVQFGEHLDEDELEYDTLFYNVTKEEGREMSVEHGVTKAVLLWKDSDVVVKIPFNGAYFDYEEYDEECKNYFSTTGFEEFHLANDIECEDASNWDYCENELLKYEKAEADGFGMFLAETRFYGKVDGYPFYLQEKVLTFDDGHSTSTFSDNSLKTSRNTKHPFPNEWFAEVIERYGEKRAMEFLEYVRENKMNRDYHCGNVGYRTNGEPVLLDFSGYREDL